MLGHGQVHFWRVRQLRQGSLGAIPRPILVRFWCGRGHEWMVSCTFTPSFLCQREACNTMQMIILRRCRVLFACSLSLSLLSRGSLINRTEYLLRQNFCEMMGIVGGWAKSSIGQANPVIPCRNWWVWQRATSPVEYEIYSVVMTTIRSRRLVRSVKM